MKTLQIDFVSDVACPWCAVGLNALERALERSGIQAELHMQPFELNPTMAAEGANAAQYLKAKYGMSDEQLDVNRARIAERGAAEGFTFGTRAQVWNTFDAHRLLHWAGVEGANGTQRALKHALLKAYITAKAATPARTTCCSTLRRRSACLSTGRARFWRTTSSPMRSVKSSASGKRRASSPCPRSW
jgi:predicted DsbA family dithiol-disulfide isomerase